MVWSQEYLNSLDSYLMVYQESLDLPKASCKGAEGGYKKLELNVQHQNYLALLLDHSRTDKSELGKVKASIIERGSNRYTIMHICQPLIKYDN